MKTMKLSPVLFVLIVIMGSSAIAQTQQPKSNQEAASAQAPDPKAIDAARRLCELTGATKFATQIAIQTLTLIKPMAKGVPEDVWEEIEKEAKKEMYDSFGDIFADIYARHFSEDEINQLIAFYQTPLGQKLIATLPTITSEGYAEGRGTREESVGTRL